MFHDCFIQGCDASVLLDDSNGNQNHLIERNAIPNQTLKGLDVIDRIKEALEVECPNTVSCSDIISLATRNAVILSGGPFFPVLTSRKDSRVSFHDDANNQIPRPESNIDETLLLFSQRGFNEKEVVSLLGAHNIGKIGCEFILKRISNFYGTGRSDPTIPSDFMVELNKICITDAPPSPSPSRLRNLIESTTGLSYFQPLAPFIFSGSGFDTHYYKSLLLGRGLLYADQQLMSNPRTARLVEVFASDDGTIFRREFSKSMLKMCNLQSYTASQGERVLLVRLLYTGRFCDYHSSPGKKRVFVSFHDSLFLILNCNVDHFPVIKNHSSSRSDEIMNSPLMVFVNICFVARQCLILLICNLVLDPKQTGVCNHRQVLNDGILYINMLDIRLGTVLKQIIVTL